MRCSASRKELEALMSTNKPTASGSSPATPSVPPNNVLQKTGTAPPPSVKPKRLWIGGLGVLALVALLAFLLLRPTHPNEVPAAPVVSAPSDVSAAVSGAPRTPLAKPSATSPAPAAFEEVAQTWEKISQARNELDNAIQARQLAEADRAAARIGDLVAALPGQSAALPEDKRHSLESHVRNVNQLANMLHAAEGTKNVTSAQEHQAAMNEALDMIQRLYPEREFEAHMHMPRMKTGDAAAAPNGMAPGIGMGDDSMSGSSGSMSGSGAGSSMGDDAMSGGSMPAGKATPGSGTSDKKPADKKPMGSMSGSGKSTGGASSGGAMTGGGMSDDSMSGKSSSGMGHM
jgi:hypothetical protein